MTSASMPATNSPKPKSPPAPSSGAAPTSLSPTSQERSPSSRAMNPSTLMPRKTCPVKEASMPGTLPDGYDDSGPDQRGAGVQQHHGVTGLLEGVVGHADHQPAGSAVRRSRTSAAA